uniref:Putative secreted protein n=1 Tax=Ixodes ricinus TaxID=34613 RepID=A0A6B0UP50_IXORI
MFLQVFQLVLDASVLCQEIFIGWFRLDRVLQKCRLRMILAGTRRRRRAGFVPCPQRRAPGPLLRFVLPSRFGAFRSPKPRVVFELGAPSCSAVAYGGRLRRVRNTSPFPRRHGHIPKGRR